MPYSNHSGFDELLQKMGAIRDAKAHDYSADDSSLGNFHLSATITGLLSSTTVLVRMCDKLARVGSLFKKGKAEVKDENIQDTLLDLANYALLMVLLLREEKRPVDFSGVKSIEVSPISSLTSTWRDKEPLCVDFVTTSEHWG